MFHTCLISPGSNSPHLGARKKKFRRYPAPLRRGASFIIFYCMVWSNFLAYSDLGFFLLRLVLGVIFIYHALPKLKKPANMAGMFGGKAWAVTLLGLVEGISGLGIILGIYLQFYALLLAVVMVGAIYFKVRKWKVSFSSMDKMGWEFDLILLGASLLLLLSGGGGILIFF